MFICSGRYPGYAKAHFSEFADGFICCNGWLAFDRDGVILSEPMPKAQVRDVAKRIRPTGVSLIFYETEWLYFIGSEKIFEQEKHLTVDGKIKKVNDVVGICPYNFDVFYDDVLDFEIARDALGDDYICNPHTPHPSADVTIRGMDKGDAVRRILEYYGITRDDAYAFGDGMNDITMLKAVGYGIAMGNALDAVKKAADYVTSDIMDDGVANGLKHFGLI